MDSKPDERVSRAGSPVGGDGGFGGEADGGVDVGVDVVGDVVDAGVGAEVLEGGADLVQPHLAVAGVFAADRREVRQVPPWAGKHLPGQDLQPRQRIQVRPAPSG